MKITITVSNSLKKDPRVIKQIKVAKANNYEVQFVGYRDAFFDKDFLDELGVRCDVIDLGEEYLGKLNSIYKKIKRIIKRPILAAKKICEFKPDVIHANDFDTLSFVYKAAKKCGARVVYDSHEVFAENIGISNNKLLNKYIIMREKYLVRRIFKMISVSNAAAEYFEKKYNIERPTVITNCPMRNTLPLKEKSDGFEVVYQGLMVAGRGYEEFVDSAKYLDDGIKLILRGYGTLESSLKEKIEKDELQNKVKFMEPVEVAQLVSAASASHLGIVITKPVNLNFLLSVSNKVFEYAAAGLPVILSDIPEHRYLNDKYNFGVILKEVTPECIAQAINELYKDTEKYNLLMKNAKTMAEEMVWENESKRLIEIYENSTSNGVFA